MALIEEAFSLDVSSELLSMPHFVENDESEVVEPEEEEFVRNQYFNPVILHKELETRTQAIRQASDELTRSEQILNKNCSDLEKITASIQSLSIVHSADVSNILEELTTISKSKKDIEIELQKNVKTNRHHLQILTNMISQTKHLCSLCMSNSIEMAIIPCGHVACSLCMQRVSQETCFACRQQINQTLKLFFI